MVFLGHAEHSLFGLVVVLLEMVDGHDAEATAIVGHGMVVVGSAPCSANGHVHLAVAHRLIGQSVQVVAGIKFLP